MKAIILTYAPIEKTEQEIIKNTNIFKLALNHHAEEYHPNKRIITDYILPSVCRKFPDDIIISVRDKFRSPSKRVEYFNTEFKGATIISAIEYLISKGFDKILIIGDNKVNSNSFRDTVNNWIDNKTDKSKIYQYTNGNFHLPITSIKEFCEQGHI
jgi:hypothetical protein